MKTAEETMSLFEFAFCGADGFNGMIKYLTELAEEDQWTQGAEENGVLHKYIKGTFSQCYSQEKIMYTDDEKYCCFNTGLLTPNGNDIVAIFEQNNRSGAQPWRLTGFFDVTQREFMNKFLEVPQLATYIKNYEELYFNPTYKIVVSTDHILDDNWERIHEVVPLDKSIVKSLLTGVIEETKKRIKRNLRLVVPQYYRKQIMYLMPIDIPISDGKKVTMALAVELTKSKQYRANTIFTKEMAYEKARLLMRPESNWLI